MSIARPTEEKILSAMDSEIAEKVANGVELKDFEKEYVGMRPMKYQRHLHELKLIRSLFAKEEPVLMEHVMAHDYRNAVRKESGKGLVFSFSNLCNYLKARMKVLGYAV